LYYLPYSTSAGCAVCLLEKSANVNALHPCKANLKASPEPPLKVSCGVG
jgi:hypothetical protein